jgi:hypothetical protein
LSGCTSARPTGGESSPTRREPERTLLTNRIANINSSQPTLFNPDYALTINITISNGKTIPSGEKINVRVGQTVILNVTSDTDDEIHAHIGGPGYELQVQAGTPARGCSPSTARAASKWSPPSREDHRDLERALATFHHFMLIPLHGIASRRDLPLPFSFRRSRCRAGLVISFAILIFAWRNRASHAWAVLRAVADRIRRQSRRPPDRPGPGPCHVRLGGTGDDGWAGLLTNPIFGFAYVWMWVGLVPISLLLGSSGGPPIHCGPSTADFVHRSRRSRTGSGSPFHTASAYGRQ